MNAKPTPPARARRTPRKNASANGAAAAAPGERTTIRDVRRGDLEAVIALDAQETGVEKRDYFRALLRRYGEAANAERRFLVAVDGDTVDGFIVGEVRDWEFGSPPCGWVFAINVRPGARQAGTGTRLLQAMCAIFRKAGTHTVRTMLSRENTLILSFFRSQGMTTGPLIPLEMSLDD